MSKKQTLLNLKQQLVAARSLVEVGGFYQHYKGGVYRVADLAIMTEEACVGVVYRADYDEDGILFVRPLEVWLEEVEHNGEKVARFAAIG